MCELCYVLMHFASVIFVIWFPFGVFTTEKLQRAHINFAMSGHTSACILLRRTTLIFNELDIVDFFLLKFFITFKLNLKSDNSNLT